MVELEAISADKKRERKSKQNDKVEKREEPWSIDTDSWMVGTYQACGRRC